MDTNLKEKQNGVATTRQNLPTGNLPTFQDLHQDPEQAFKNDQFKSLLYKDPPKSWIKVNKYANNSQYLPIDKNEYLLDSIFQEWKVEILGYSQLFNAVACTVRVHYLNPINGQWYFHDGGGAEDVQVKAGSSPSDLSNINKGAVGMALPNAISSAIKDACHHLGRIFGRDLNRAEPVQFTGAYSPHNGVDLGELGALYESKKKKLSADEKTRAEEIINNREAASYLKLKNLLESK